MTLPKIYKEDNCLYLYQDISHLDLYEKSKAIVNFCDKETKQFEKTIDAEILDIFKRNGINIPNTNKSVLKQALGTLKDKGIEIIIKDLYEDIKYKVVDEDLYTYVCETKNHFVVMIETDYASGIKTETIQCGISIEERKIK